MKMAEQKRRNGVLSKGMKVPVTIEEAINDVLVVCLETGSKIFRGILLDMKKRSLPHGVPWQFNQGGSDNGKNPLSTVDGDSNSQPEVSATSYRHTYQQPSLTNAYQPPPHPVSLTRAFNKDKNMRRIRLRPRQTLCNKCKAMCTETEKGIIPVTAVMKPQKPATERVRHSSPSQMARRPLKEGLRKRPAAQSSSQPQTYPSRRKSLIQSKPVTSKKVLTRSDSLPERKVVLSRRESLIGNKQVTTRRDSATDVKSALSGKSSAMSVKPVLPRRDSATEVKPVLSRRDSFAESRIVLTHRDSVTDGNVPTRKESNSDSIIISSRRDSNPDNKSQLSRKDSNGEAKAIPTVAVDSTKVQKVDKSSVVNTKASPLIKITIGEGTVLKIPPRIHGNEVDGEGDLESPAKTQETDSNDQNSSSEEVPPHKKLKKTFKKPKEKKDSENSSSGMQMSYLVSSHHKKHKRKHRHRHGNHDNDGDVFQPEGDMLDMFDENGESQSEATQTEVISQRPRLLYTWRQNKGLSPRRDVNKGLSPRHENSSFSNIERSMSPPKSVKSNENVQVQKKEYRLRSRERTSTESESLDSVISCESSESCEEDDILGDGYTIQTVPDSEDDQSDKSDDCTDSEDEMEEGPPGDSSIETIRPLMMKIQSHDVTKCVATDGRSIHVGDIVWGKIQGFPWWPGRVLSITVSQRDNGIMIRQLAHVSWFGSSTMSHIQCSDLYPFLEDFKLRFNRKKRGPYKMAIKQATIAAQSINNTHHIDFTQFDL